MDTTKRNLRPTASFLADLIYAILTVGAIWLIEPIVFGKSSLWELPHSIIMVTGGVIQTLASLWIVLRSVAAKPIAKRRHPKDQVRAARLARKISRGSPLPIIITIGTWLVMNLVYLASV